MKDTEIRKEAERVLAVLKGKTVKEISKILYEAKEIMTETTKYNP